LGTNKSGGESTLDFIQRLITNAFSEIDDWEMERSVGFVDHGDLDQKSKQPVQSKNATTKKTVSKPVNNKPMKLKKKSVKSQQKPVQSVDKTATIREPISLEPLKTIKTIPTQKFKSFTDTNLGSV